VGGKLVLLLALDCAVELEQQANVPMRGGHYTVSRHGAQRLCMSSGGIRSASLSHETKRYLKTKLQTLTEPRH